MSGRLYCLIAVFIAVFLFPGLVFGQEILTWQDCVRQALSQNPDLISARESLNQSLAQKKIAQSDLLPQVSASATSTRARSTSGTEDDTYTYGLNGEQLLFDGMKTIYSSRQAGLQAEAARFEYDVASSNVYLSLRQAFVELLRAEDLVRLTEEISARRKQNVDMVQLRYEAGREHKGALLTAQANLAQAQYEVKEAQRTLELARRNLLKELGRESFDQIKVKGELKLDSAVQTEPDLFLLAETTPFLQKLISRKDASLQGLKAAKADFWPAVYASGSYGKTNSQWPPRDESWSTGIRVSLPLFEGAGRIQEVKKTRAAYNQADAEARSGRDSVIVTLAETWIDLMNAGDKVDVRRKFLAASEERSKIAQAQYSNGLISFDDWTIIEDGLVSDKKDFLNARADALKKEAFWLQAKGVTLENASQ